MEKRVGFLTGLFLMIAIVSFGMTVINVGLSNILLSAWLSLYPIMFAAGFIVALLLGPWALKLAKKF